LDEWVPRICGHSMESDTGNNALSLSTVQLEKLRLITAGCPRRKPASEVGRFDRLESHMLQSVAAVYAIDMCGNKAERVWLL
jgi:hypothetical protein